MHVHTNVQKLRENFNFNVSSLWRKTGSHISWFLWHLQVYWPFTLIACPQGEFTPEHVCKNLTLTSHTVSHHGDLSVIVIYHLWSQRILMNLQNSSILQVLRPFGHCFKTLLFKRIICAQRIKAGKCFCSLYPCPVLCNHSIDERLIKKGEKKPTHPRQSSVIAWQGYLRCRVPPCSLN